MFRTTATPSSNQTLLALRLVLGSRNVADRASADPLLPAGQGAGNLRAFCMPVIPEEATRALANTPAH